MVLLLDVGNTHTHAGLANDCRITKKLNFATDAWMGSEAPAIIDRFVSGKILDAAVFSSVVPKVTPRIRRYVAAATLDLYELTGSTARKLAGLGIDYPDPASIGADRLANAIAAKELYGAPAVVVDFGTAVTFDVLDRAGNYVGGIIAPGLASMTDYLHEKTALLPRIKIQDVKKIIGKNTKEAMVIGAVYGYRGLIRELLLKLKAELGEPKLNVVATGGYAELIAGKLPEITAVNPLLTLEGLRLFHRKATTSCTKSC